VLSIFLSMKLRESEYFSVLAITQQNYEIMTQNPERTPDKYYSIASRERTELVVKASRFIASVAPVASKDEALAYIADIRKEFYDATHNCFAYRLGPQGLNARAADDGEPSGTAGKPMLFVLQKVDVSDVVAVVTRYYGGTKLGVGPLARAYSDSLAATLQLCAKREILQTAALRVFCVYEDVAVVKRLLHQHAVRYEETYGDAVEFVAHFPQSAIHAFPPLLTEATSARAGVVMLGDDDER
jgi:uncharacterized YigZ family protein